MELNHSPIVQVRMQVAKEARKCYEMVILLSLERAFVMSAGTQLRWSQGCRKYNFVKVLTSLSVHVTCRQLDGRM
jgi:hypothetical protein